MNDAWTILLTEAKFLLRAGKTLKIACNELLKSSIKWTNFILLIEDLRIRWKYFQSCSQHGHRDATSFESKKATDSNFVAQKRPLIDNDALHSNDWCFFVFCIKLSNYEHQNPKVVFIIKRVSRNFLPNNDC